MTTTTLSSKGRFKNLLVGMLRKNLSVAVYLSVIFFLVFPLQVILDTINTAQRMSLAGATLMGWDGLMAGLYTNVSMVMVVGILVLSAFVMGLVQCSYLHSKRAVDLYHSLPVTRTQLMTANLLTAFVTVMVPFFINYLLNLCAVFYRKSVLGSFAGVVLPSFVFWDLLGWCVAVFAILAVVMLVSTQVGSIFENFLFAGELLAAPVVIIYINELLCQEFLVGYVGTMYMDRVATSSPASIMAGMYAAMEISGKIATISIISILVWAVLGAAIFVTALYLGRRRNSELAETAGCKGAVGNVLTAIAVYIGGIAAGSLLYSTFGQRGETQYLVAVAIGAVLVFFLVEAILNRGFAGVRKTLPLGAVSVAIVLLATLMITSGGSGGGWGYEMRRPLAEKVESITFDYRGWYDYVNELDTTTQIEYTDSYKENVPNYTYNDISQVTLVSPEAIDLMRDIHLLMIDGAQNNEIDYRSSNKMVQYTLKNGKTLLRQYYGYNEATAKYLRKLCETQEFQEQTNPVLRVKSADIQSIGLHDSLGFVKYELGISNDMSTLLEAMRQDARANGTRDFTAGSAVLGYIYVNTGGDDVGNRSLTENLITNFSVPVFASSTKTIAALDAMGKGDAFGAPDLSAVTQVGFDRYNNWFRGENLIVSGVDSFMGAKDPHDYMADYDSSMEQSIAGAVRFVESRDYYSGGSGDYGFLTLYKGEEVGITVMVPPEQLPQSIKDMFPDVLGPDIGTEYWD